MFCCVSVKERELSNGIVFRVVRVPLLRCAHNPSSQSYPSCVRRVPIVGPIVGVHGGGPEPLFFIMVPPQSPWSLECPTRTKSVLPVLPDPDMRSSVPPWFPGPPTRVSTETRVSLRLYWTLVVPPGSGLRT